MPADFIDLESGDWVVQNGANSAACVPRLSPLSKTIPNRALVSLAQIPEILLALSLVLLFSPGVLELLIEVANLIGQFRYMRSVGFYVSLCRADNDVEVETRICVTKPRSVIRRETDGVVACFDRCECEFAFQRACV